MLEKCTLSGGMVQIFMLIGIAIFPQVVFEGVRGVNIAGDIAIDDITLANGLCSGLLQC